MEKVGSKPYVYPQNDRHIFGQKRFRIKSLHQHLMKYVQGNSQVPPPNPQKVYKKLVALINNGGARGKKTPVPFSIFSGNSISLEQIKCLCVLVKSLLKDPKIKKGRVQLNSMKNSLNQYFARRRSMRRVTKPAFPLVMKTMVLHDLQNTGVRKKAFDGQSIKALIGVEQNCETIVSACGQWINGCLKNEEVVDLFPDVLPPKGVLKQMDFQTLARFLDKANEEIVCQVFSECEFSLGQLRQDELGALLKTAFQCNPKINHSPFDKFFQQARIMIEKERFSFGYLGFYHSSEVREYCRVMGDNLNYLELSGYFYEDIEHICKLCPNLKCLDLYEFCSISERHQKLFEPIGALKNVEELYLRCFSNVKDAAFDFILQLSNLKTLHLEACDMSDCLLATLLTKLPKLEKLVLISCSSLTHSVLSALNNDNNPEIKEVQIYNCALINTDQVFCRLKESKKLERLLFKESIRAKNGTITEKGVSDLEALSGQLKHLQIELVPYRGNHKQLFGCLAKFESVDYKVSNI